MSEQPAAAATAAGKEAPRWLTADEQQAWIGLTAIMWLLPGPLDAQLVRDSQLNLFEYFVLSSLSMAEDRSRRMSDLAADANASPSRLSNVVGRLEARGLLARQTDPTDRRGTSAVLTDAGQELVVAAAPGHVAAVRRLVIDRLTPAQISALGGIRQHLFGSGIIEPCEADPTC